MCTVHRGFKGRALWRRLQLRSIEEKRQRRNKADKINKLLATRKMRNAFCVSIQRVFRGWSCRHLIKYQNLCAIHIQRIVR